MNSFNDLMNDYVTIKEKVSAGKGYGDTVDGTSETYQARVQQVTMTIKNANGNIVYPDYKIYMTKNIPESISYNAVINYNGKDYVIEKIQAAKNENGKLVAWVIFI